MLRAAVDRGPKRLAERRTEREREGRGKKGNDENEEEDEEERQKETRYGWWQYANDRLRVHRTRAVRFIHACIIELREEKRKESRKKERDRVLL